MSNIPVIKFTFQKDWKPLTEALVSKNPYEAKDFKTANDLASYLATIPACLIFASLNGKDDLVQLATLVKIAKKVAKDTVLKVVVVNFSGNKQFEKAIQKLGLLDVVEPTINTKGLRFKIDFYMKSINGQIKSNSANSAIKTVKSTDAKAHDKKVVNDQVPNWVAPIDCQDDIWLLVKDVDCKKVLGRWLVRFTGPGPGVAQWTEIKNKKNAWKFEFKGDERELFLKGTGTWYFLGDQKPEFVWKENIWLMTGSSFELFYYENEKKVPRLRLKDKVLELCKNSEYAQSKSKLIIESFDKEHVFKKDADRINSNAEVDGESGTDRLGNLSGKGKTDHMKSGPLEGKTDGSVNLNSGHLEGKTEGTDKLNSGPLEGKTKGTDSISSNPMTMDLNPEDNTLDSPLLSQAADNAKLGRPLKGKSSTDAIDNSGMKGPGSEAHRKGASLDMENSKAELQTHYKGHNEAEEFAAKELHKNKYQEETRGPNSGKSSTDHIPKFYKKGGSEEENEPSPEDEQDSASYTGKGKTDKIATHYGNGSKRVLDGVPEAKAKHQTDTEAGKSIDEEELEEDLDVFDLDEDTDLESLLADDRDTEEKFSDHEEEVEEEVENETKLEEFDDFEDLEDRQVQKQRLEQKKRVELQQENHKLEQNPEQKSRSEQKQNPEQKLKLDQKQKPDQKQKTGEEDQGDGEGADVISISAARDHKNKQQAAPEEVDKELSEMVEEAKIKCVLTQGPFSVNCNLDDFFEQTLIFTSPKSGVRQDKIMVNVKFNYKKKETEIGFQGVVTTVDTDDDGNQHYVSIDISEKDAVAFGEFMKLFQARQGNIDSFLKKVRGY